MQASTKVKVTLSCHQVRKGLVTTNYGDSDPDVMDGDQQSLIMLPDNSFHYGKGKDQVVIHIQLILERIKELEDQIEVEKQTSMNPSSSAEKEEKELNVLEKEHMKNLADGLLTEQAEGDIYHRFHELLHDEIGF